MYVCGSKYKQQQSFGILKMDIKPFPYDDSDIDNQAITTNITTPDHPEVAVPKNIIAALDDQIADLKKQVEEDGGTAIQRDTQVFSNQQEFLMEVIEKLQMLKHELTKNTEDGFKRAQIAWAQIPNYMWKYVPGVVCQYIHRTKAETGETLLSAFYNNKPFKSQK